MAIKVSRGKLTLAQPVSSLVSAQIAQNQFQTLTITHDHTYGVETMAFHNDHDDPFDRLLIVQALQENLVILTRDSEFAPYGVPTLW